MNNIRASIIVPTRNRCDDLCGMLESVVGQEEKPLEVVIIDSSDVPIDLHKKFQDIRALCFSAGICVVYKHVKICGASHQRNIAMQHTQGNIYHFLDDDVILQPDYISNMHEIFKKYPQYVGGMGTVRCAPPRFGWHRLLRIVFLLPRNGGVGTFTFSGMPVHAYGTSIFKDVEILGGCCMCMQAEIAKQFGFDENLGAYSYMEDCDFSWRISRMHKLFYNPHAILEHKCSLQARDSVVETRARFMGNYRYLFFKNFYSNNYLRIIGYWWSIFGLFVEAVLLCKKEYLNGYVKGLRNYKPLD